MTPSHTAVILADGSANKIGATIGTTTTAISIKSRKKPRTKITNITMINLDQKPPGNEFKNSLTKSSPPKALKAAVKSAAPSKIIKTNEVVLAVSNMTPSNVFLTSNNLHPLQIKEIINAIVAKIPM